MKRLTYGKNGSRVCESWLDTAIRTVAPEAGARRFAAKVQTELGVQFLNRYGANTGASRSANWAKNWQPGIGDANADSLDDLEDLRANSEDLVRNHGLAASAVKSKATYCIGTGLTLNARVDYEALGLSREQGQELNRIIERNWKKFCIECDVRGKQSFRQLQYTAFKSRMTRGDCFLVRRSKPVPGHTFSTKVQLVEADVCRNPDGMPNGQGLYDGVRTDSDGMPISYIFASQHPGDDDASYIDEYTEVPVYNRIGLKNVIHYHRVGRIGEARGIPELAPVVEIFKQISNLVSSELTASVVQSMFTVFLKTPSGDAPLLPMQGGDLSNSPTAADNKNMQLGHGAIVELAQGEDPVMADPSRPNSNLDAFIYLMLEHMAPAIEMPVEVVIGHYKSSYTAARAAFEGLWKVVKIERMILEEQICREIYRWFMFELVAKETLSAPGFFTSPEVQEAYLNSEWIGPAKGTIDEVKDAVAAEKWLEMMVKPRSTVIQEVTGQDPDGVKMQIAAEQVERANLERELGVES